ncbi:hypothetical protein C8R45DRAFT_1217006 [Mycena sanguinolenta]|nr:hypothetical protein C8R45DRAFT_1217006 [Mycena sanguinolenta]
MRTHPICTVRRYRLQRRRMIQVFVPGKLLSISPRDQLTARTAPCSNIGSVIPQLFSALSEGDNCLKVPQFPNNRITPIQRKAMDSTSHNPSPASWMSLPIVNGGKGGRGGKADRIGGGGGLGGAPHLATNDVQSFREINGGIGGDGGEGGILGGVGGVGEGPKISNQQLLVSVVEAKSLSVPNVLVGDFCRQYRLSDKIRVLLDEYGFETVAAILEVSDSALNEAGLKSGQIVELERALRDFVADNLVSEESEDPTGKCG